MSKTATAISPEMLALSTHIASALRRRLPPKIRQLAKEHLVDAYAAMLSGSRLVPGQRAIAYVRTLGGTRESSVIGTRWATSAYNAALANGMCAHADETDGAHPPTISHPDASVIPAALAICERNALSGTALLRAIALGYDVGTRVLLALGPVPLLLSGHFSAAFGQVFGAAAAASALLGLDARRARHALSYTAQQAAGIYTMFRDSEHVEKAFGMGGMPAANGVAAALMVAHGFTGVDDVFSGERDFFHTFAPDGKGERAALARGLGIDYEISRAAIKRWPAGGPIQAPLDLVTELRAAHGFAVNDVIRLTVRVPQKILDVINDRAMPDISLQHLLAVTLVDGTLTHDTAHDYRRLRNPKIAALKRRIEAVGDPRLTEVRSASMEIELADGRRLSRETFAAKGSFRNPLTPEELEHKALGLIEPVLGKARARKLLDALWRVEALDDLRALRRLASA